jgi:hypothetical protein
VASALVTLSPGGSTTTAASGLTFAGSSVMVLIMDGLAVLALGFLVLTFIRRRIPSPSSQ